MQWLIMNAVSITDKQLKLKLLVSRTIYGIDKNVWVVLFRIIYKCSQVGSV